MNDKLYFTKLLDYWEEVYKKGQLTLWVLLALKNDPKTIAEIEIFISSVTNGMTSMDRQSLYRSLRRYYDAEIISFKLGKSRSGPDHKIYFLTPLGLGLLKEFIQRNIIKVFYQDDVRKLIKEK